MASKTNALLSICWMLNKYSKNQCTLLFRYVISALASLHRSKYFTVLLQSVFLFMVAEWMFLQILCYGFLPTVLYFRPHFCCICRSLQRTLNELKEYQKQHDHYLRQQEALDKHKLLQEEQILHNIIHETQMAKEAQLGTMPCRNSQFS